MFEQEQVKKDDSDIADLLYLGSTRVKVNTIIEKSMLQVVYPRSEDEDQPVMLGDPSEYDCMQNVIYDQKRCLWAKSKDEKSDISPDQNDLAPVMLTELENFEIEDSRSLLKYSNSYVESRSGAGSPQKNERHSFLLKQLMTGKISLKFKMDVRSQQFIQR